MLELTTAEIDALVSHRSSALVANGTWHLGEDALIEKLMAERARLVKIAEQAAKYKAEQELAERNWQYVDNDLREGDLVEFTYFTRVGYGKNATHKYVTRRMIVSQVAAAMGRGEVNIHGVVVTKNGKPHGTLNTNNGTRSEYGVPKSAVNFIARQAAE